MNRRRLGRAFFAATLLFIIPQACRAQASYDATYWNLLLHYQKGWLGGYASEARSPGFFVSPTGRTNPQAELNASLQALAEKRLIRGEPFACRYPARFRYLRATHALGAEEPTCPKLNEWKAQFAANSVTVVFATAYLGNVASTFGHTFLKVDAKAGRGRKSELLDLGISFAADNDPHDNPIAFAWKGLTGGYFEKLSIMPYFTRLAEYHDIENRDVWEYKLKIDPAQADQLLNHAWELRDSQMDYFFLNRNCSYHVMALLQAANPEWRLTEPFSYFALPTDGIQALASVGSVAEVGFRPSKYHKLKQKTLAMSAGERAAFEKSRSSGLALSGDESGLVLEALLDYQQFAMRPPDREMLPSEQAKQLELFRKLASAKIAPAPLPPIAADSQPDLGHASRKASLAIGSGQADNYLELELRPTLHDLLDNDEGYAPFSQIVAGQARFRYSESQKTAELRDFELVNIISLTPVDALAAAPSWLVQAGARVPPDSACASCLSAELQGGVGLSAYLMPRTENAILFTFFKLNVEAGSGTPGSFRWGPSELLGADFKLSRSVKFLTELEIMQNFDQHFSGVAGPSFDWAAGTSWYALKNFEMRLVGGYRRLPEQDFISASLGAGIYF